jgi:hypothetical protein
MSALLAEADGAGRAQARLSPRSRRGVARLAGLSALIIGALALLAVGAALGNAVRKRLDRWGHAWF